MFCQSIYKIVPNSFTSFSLYLYLYKEIDIKNFGFWYCMEIIRSSAELISLLCQIPIIYLTVGN